MLIKARERDIPGALAAIRKRNLTRGRRPIEVGHTGLEVFSGIITGDSVEHNRDWIGKGRYKWPDRMRKGDATCAATLAALALPVVSTDVEIETRQGADSHRPDPIVKEAADFINQNLFDQMSRSWYSWLREVFLYQAYGHYAFEKIFTEIKSGDFKGAMGWKEFAPRHPSTFEYYWFDDHGHFRGVQQQALTTESNSYVTKDIDISKMLWFTHQEEAGNPLGTSVLRPAYKHWKYKDGFYSVQAIAVERQGAGIPYAKYPTGAKSTDVDEAEEMLQNIQAHEQSYITFDAEWEVGFVDMGQGKVLDPKDAIEHHDQMIPKSILAGFLNLTQGDRGSFALSSDSSGFFTYSIQQTAGLIAGVINEAIKELLDYNYPNLPSYPKLRFNKVGHISVEKILDELSKLGAQGFITPTVDLENHIRDLLNLPSLGIEDFEGDNAEVEQAKADMEVEKAGAIADATAPPVPAKVGNGNQK